MSDSTLLRLVPEAERGQAGVIKALEEVLARAKAGEIVGLVAAYETKTGYEHTRVNMSLELALGVTVRLQYKLNKNWDEA